MRAEVEQIKVKNKQEDKKAMKGFVIFIVIAAIIGGIAGGFSEVIEKNLSTVVPMLISEGLIKILPVGFWMISAITLTVSLVTYVKCKKQYEVYLKQPDEDEEAIEGIENLLNIPLVSTSVCMINVLFVIAAVFNLEHSLTSIVKTTTFVGCFVVIIAGIILQMLVVNFEKEMNPEKQGSVFDSNFADKWVESCDEAEKMMVYKSAYAAYKATNVTCITFWFILFFSDLMFHTGLLPIAVVVIIWLVQTLAYSIKAVQLEKRKA